MQYNFECISKFIVALTFSMCVDCSHYQYSFLMFYIILLFSFYVLVLFSILFCLIFLNEREKKKGSKKKNKKKKKS